jgi:hypothetical protein
MSTGESFFVKTAWKADDLRDKRVEFLLSAPERQVAGIGIFRVAQRTTEQRIEIVVTTETGQRERTDTIFTLRQLHADRIEPHPDGTIAEFRVIA